MSRKAQGTSRAWVKKLGLTSQDAEPPFKGQEGDIIVLVMGPTGVGKSTFIKEYTKNQNVIVGHQLQSCTRDVTWFEASVPPALAHHPKLRDRRLILVDTPGFDDTFSDDSDILQRISTWLAQSYNDQRRISGVVYMNDISQKRMFGSTRMNLNMFTKLCGDNSYRKVVLATSQWDNLPNDRTGEQRQKELSQDFWKSLLDHGAKIMPIRQKPEDQIAIMNHLIDVVLASEESQKKQDEVLQIQKEIVDLEKSIPATAAGKELKYTLEELLRLQNAAQANPSDEKSKQALEEKKALVKKQLKALKLSFGERLRSFFGF